MPFDEAQVQNLLAQTQGWHLNNTGEIEKLYKFGDFVQSLAFVNKVGTIAEDLGHHPDITINYNKVKLSVTTHDAGGLTQKDFDLAARVDQLVQ